LILRDSGTDVYDLGTRQVIKTLDGVLAYIMAPDINAILSVRLSDGELALWDMTSWEMISSFSVPSQFLGFPTLSFNGQMLAIPGEAGFVSVLNILPNQEPSLRADFKAHKRDIPRMAFSPDNRMLATVSTTDFGVLWNTENWNSMATLRGHSKGIHGISFSADSRRVLTSGSAGDAIKLWDMDSYQEVATLSAEGNGFMFPSLSKNGRTLAAISINNGNPVLHVWRAPTWEDIEAAEARESRRIPSP
jgi:WD40 repeat protein